MTSTACLAGRWLMLIPTLAGSINEFRIYSGVLSTATLALDDAAGPGQPRDQSRPVQALHFSAPVNPLVVNQSSQQILTADFTNVTGLDLIAYGGATFSSSNTGVLTINTNGVVKAVAAGTANVVASYGGLSATNTLTVISLPAVLAHRYSFNGTDASDSVGGANGTLMGNATVTGGQLVLDGNFGVMSICRRARSTSPRTRAVTFEAWVSFGNPATWAYSIRVRQHQQRRRSGPDRLRSLLGGRRFSPLGYYGELHGRPHTELGPRLEQSDRPCHLRGGSSHEHDFHLPRRRA